MTPTIRFAWRPPWHGLWPMGFLGALSGPVVLVPLFCSRCSGPGKTGHQRRQEFFVEEGPDPLGLANVAVFVEQRPHSRGMFENTD